MTAIDPSIGADDAAPEPEPPTFRGIHLDRFQIEAFQSLDDGKSVLVAAPTGSGKTLVAEYAIARAAERGQRSIYTTPIKALSNQKFNDLAQVMGRSSVGLLTGDNSIRPDASVVVMTTEVLRNMIYSRSPALADVGVIVIDEVHYLQDRYRGPVWEEVIVHAPEGPQMVCLSATVSNATELGAWIEALRGPTDTIIQTKRPVELQHWFAATVARRHQLDVISLFADRRPTTKGADRRANPDGKKYETPTPQRDRGRNGSRGGKSMRSPFSTPARADLIEYLEERSMLPAIWFIFSRRGCDDAATGLRRSGFVLVDRTERAEIEAIIERHTAGIDPNDLDALGFRTWRAALLRGFAAHHAGLIPAFKEATEAAFARGLLKVVFATETLALGINMPARTVVIDKLTKYGGSTAAGSKHERLTPAQFTQMTGRAGRRGIDSVGHAFVLWSPFTPFSEAAELADNDEYPLKSAFRPTFNMAANLIRRYQRDEAISVLRRSFAQFQMDRTLVEDAQHLRSSKAKAEEYFAQATCDRGDIEEALLERSTSKPQRPTRPKSSEITRVLSNLRPGVILSLGGNTPPVVVLSVGIRSAEQVTVRLMTVAGRVANLDPRDFDSVPAVIGLLDVPTPVRPTESSWRRKVAAIFEIHLRSNPSTGPATTPRSADQRRSRGSGDPRDHATTNPVLSCPDFSKHVAAWNRYQRTMRNIASIERRANRAASSLEATFTSIHGVLTKRGYTDGWALTERGVRLSGLYHECDLLISQAYETGLLTGLTKAELAAVVSMFTFEQRRVDEGRMVTFPTDRVRRRYETLVAAHHSIAEDENAARLPVSRGPDPGFVHQIFQWSNGIALPEIVDDDLTGGDFVRNIKQVVDLLRQIAAVAHVGEVARQCDATAELLVRGVVEQSQWSMVDASNPTLDHADGPEKPSADDPETKARHDDFQK